MRAAIRSIASFWFTAWIDGGQPDLTLLINYRPSEQELQQNRQAYQEWKNGSVKARPHESDKE